MTVCIASGCGSKADAARGMCWAHYNMWRGKARVRASTRKQETQWLREHVEHDGAECLVWPFERTKRGYGRYRQMTILAHGNPPFKGAHASHSCGNGAGGCVNPRHLRWATPAENMEDKRTHGTLLYGEAAPWSKLSAKQVAEIRMALSEPSWGLQRKLAKQYGVHEMTISDIKRGKKWKPRPLQINSN